MSRIGKKPITVPQGAQMTLSGQDVKVKGPKGELSFKLIDEVLAKLEQNELTLSPRDDSQRARAMWGMARSIVANNVTGVTTGFEKNLELTGVGYRAQMKGSVLVLQLGYSHDVEYTPKPGVKIETPKPTEIKISGIDKQAVGQTAAEIRSYRPPEPYKGKGVKFAGEVVRRKEGKKK
jgi:large subunit ribosomal protein L6